MNVPVPEESTGFLELLPDSFLEMDIPTSLWKLPSSFQPGEVKEVLIWSRGVLGLCVPRGLKTREVRMGSAYRTDMLVLTAQSCLLSLVCMDKGSWGWLKGPISLLLWPPLASSRLPLLQSYLWQGLVVSGSCLPSSFISWIVYGTAISCLLYLRMKKKNLPRPYKVDFWGRHWAFPIIGYCTGRIIGPQLHSGPRGRM